MTPRPNERVRALRKAGKIEEACDLAHDLRDSSPNDVWLKSELGWVLYEKLKEIVARAKSDQINQFTASRSEVHHLLREYARLGLRRPDLLFSRILILVLQHPKAEDLEFLPNFMMWAGLSSFRKEDFLSGEAGGRVYEPLIVRAAMNTAKVARRAGGREAKQFAIALLDKALAEADVQRPALLNYNKALLLSGIGQDDEAALLLAKVVRDKPGEYWAWQALGRAVASQDVPLALEIHARAWLAGRRRPDYSIKVIEDLGKLAALDSQNQLAKWAVDEALSIRRAKGSKEQPFMRKLVNSDWYAETEALSDPEPVLQELAANADRALYIDCPRLDASFLSGFTGHHGEQMARVVVKDGTRAEGFSARLFRRTDLAQFRTGDPLTVIVYRDSREAVLVEIRRRERGEPYDCLDVIDGVIENHDDEKGRAKVSTPATKYGTLISYKKFPLVNAWKPGTQLKMRCAWFSNGPMAFQLDRVDSLDTL